ncbi:hypothetical protein GCM10010234_45570 [Streptomyces hawaiiensis]
MPVLFPLVRCTVGAVGRSDGAFNGRSTSDPKHLRILELRHGTIRAQALSPRESLAFIEQLLGET